jgi:hypothetical protein
MVRTRHWGERLWVPFSHPAWQPSDLRSDATKKGEEDGPFEKYDPKISRVRKMSGAVNLILITLLLLLAQQSEMLVGFEMYVWALMLWLGVANAALLSNVDSRLFRLQEIVKALTLGVFALQLPTFTAILVISLALLGSGWQWVASKEVAVATS